MNNPHLNQLLKECDEQISKASMPVPASTLLWILCLLFFVVILFPFLVFPLLAKIDQVRPYLEGIDLSKFDTLLSKNSIHILFYALPAAIVITHGISVSAWKTSISETMRLRLFKLAVLRVATVLETKEWLENEEIRKPLLERAFDIGLTSLTVASDKKDEKAPETGVPSVDLILRAIEKLDKQLSFVGTTPKA